MSRLLRKPVTHLSTGRLYPQANWCNRCIKRHAFEADLASKPKHFSTTNCHKEAPGERERLTLNSAKEDDAARHLASDNPLSQQQTTSQVVDQVATFVTPETLDDMINSRRSSALLHKADIWQSLPDIATLGGLTAIDGGSSGSTTEPKSRAKRLIITSVNENDENAGPENIESENYGVETINVANGESNDSDAGSDSISSSWDWDFGSSDAGAD